MTQEPPIEEKIARLVERAIFDRQETERSEAAALLYMVSGVKTMYKSKDQTCVLFSPNEEEKEEQVQWRKSNSQVTAMKHDPQKHLHALTNRAMFHMSSFFILFSATLLLEIRETRKYADEQVK